MEPVPTGQLCAITIGGVNIWLYIFAILLLGCSAYFSASELAFTTVNQIRLKNLADNKVRGARKAIYIVEHYNKTLSTILIGNNLVNIGTTTICAYIFSTLIKSPTLANVLNTVIMTLIILTFGEILPKTIAKADPQKFALRTSGIMYILLKVLTPISWIFIKMQSVATKKSKNQIDDEPTVTEGELESIIDTMEEEGVIDHDNADIMQGVLDLQSRTAYDIMTPRVDVSAINYTDSVKNIQDVFMQTMYSRLPVYDETIDKIIGVLNQKDFFKAMLSGEKIYIKKIMSEPLFINENMKVDDVIRKMQASKKHMAVVLDEHGGTSGIVCMEDAIEEMVGEIYDEHDDDVKELVDKKNDNEYIVDPDMELKDLFEMLEIEHLPETTYTSVGGFLFDLSEELPVQGKVIKYSTIDERVVDGLYVSVPVEIHFTLTKVEDNRIKEIFVKVVDVDASADKKDETHESLIEKHKKKRQKKAESKNSDN
ncbi:MAG: hemolysin family protein [Firmicutes bacterium]|nr:hemolysin family protein [Bacillota bacterium]MDY5676360.1 hemolysin family protein [Eubacteriales bacterium]